MIEKAPRVIDSRLPGVNGVFQTKPKTKPSTATKFKVSGLQTKIDRYAAMPGSIT
jgi:hypothetical protein